MVKNDYWYVLPEVKASNCPVSYSINVSCNLRSRIFPWAAALNYPISNLAFALSFLNLLSLLHSVRQKAGTALTSSTPLALPNLSISGYIRKLVLSKALTLRLALRAKAGMSLMMIRVSLYLTASVRSLYLLLRGM